MGTTDLERVINIVQEPVTQTEQRALQWMALLKTGLGDDGIVVDVPEDMKPNLSLDKLYKLFLEQPGLGPSDQQVLKDIQTLMGGIDKASEAPYLRVNGNNVACKLDKSGQVEVPVNIDLTNSGLVAAMKRDPSQKFVLYKVEATKGPKVGYANIHIG